MSRKQKISDNDTLVDNPSTEGTSDTAKPIIHRRVKDSLQVFFQQVTKSKATLVFCLGSTVVNWYFLDIDQVSAELGFFNPFDAASYQRAIRSRTSPYKLVMELDTSANGMLQQPDDDTLFTELTLDLTNMVMSWFTGRRYLQTTINDMRDKVAINTLPDETIAQQMDENDIPF